MGSMAPNMMGGTNQMQTVNMGSNTMHNMTPSQMNNLARNSMSGTNQP
jgi:hypothetical protein